MTRSSALAKRIQEVLLNGTWIANTNWKEQVQAVTWEEAVQSIENLNTIALLTFHVNYYLQGMLQFFDSGNLDIRDKYSFDLPEIQSDEDWKHLVQDFIHNAERFVQSVKQLHDSILDQDFVDEKYGSYLRNLEGVIEHSYYHLGQVSLIRKLIQEKNAAR
ncbi:MAG: DUF1572 domain-containing protein [Bacteroidetes bacterium RIFCSPHIGHO2_02_FULL_44_7]|nr:MAG: DUF1572 domain-containing protein [Bacteroidetes bacterium RIFCSPHIGHO2_02_FULL_44_7]